MNILVDTEIPTLQTLPSPSKMGLWIGHAPTALQQPMSRQFAASTVVGLTLATMLGGVLITQNELPPTFADTTKFITPSRIIERKGSMPTGYEINQSQNAAVIEYLKQHINSRDFLREVAVIIDGVYGAGVARNIHVVDDVDTGKPIMELTIQSGLPLDDEFIKKDQLLFQRIEASGIAWGLRDVVISQN